LNSKKILKAKRIKTKTVREIRSKIISNSMFGEKNEEFEVVIIYFIYFLLLFKLEI
jgi:hypothetical protein